MVHTIEKIAHKRRRNAEPKTPTPRVLGVDDDPDIHTSIEMRLRPYDVEVEHAYYGMQGVVEAIKTRIDLILLDVAMPNGNGEYLLNYLRTNNATAEVPVIVLTGMRDPNLKRRLLRQGASAYVSKPVLFDDLRREMSRFIDLEERTEGGGWR